MNNEKNPEDDIEKRFEDLYPSYDYTLESSRNEKDSRKRKKMKTLD